MPIYNKVQIRVNMEHCIYRPEILKNRDVPT